jgi:Zn-dependent protease
MGINGILALMIIGSFLGAIVLREGGQMLVGFWIASRLADSQSRPSLHFRLRFSVQGTLFCVLVAFQPLFPVGLGWSKPLPADTWLMQVAGRRGRCLMALAGPLGNAVVGVLIALSLRLLAPFLLSFDTLLAQRLLQIVLVFACVNVSLALFTLIPLYPLDGYLLVRSILPVEAAKIFSKTAYPGLALIWLLFFILPFLLQLSGGSSFLLFRFPNVILSGSWHLVAWVMGFPTSLDLVRGLYMS